MFTTQVLTDSQIGCINNNYQVRVLNAVTFYLFMSKTEWTCVITKTQHFQ